MAQTYKAVTRIKTGSKDEGFDYIERGEQVSGFDDDEIQSMLASGSIVESDEFDEEFPKDERPDNDPVGTPSNLHPVEDTPLAAGDDGTGDSDSVNDADTSDEEDDSNTSPSGSTV